MDGTVPATVMLPLLVVMDGFGLAALLVHLGAIDGVTPAAWRRFVEGLQR